jgi:hypothetical protein
MAKFPIQDAVSRVACCSRCAGSGSCSAARRRQQSDNVIGKNDNRLVHGARTVSVSTPLRRTSAGQTMHDA